MKLKFSDELVDGKYGIGYTSSYFDERFRDEEFEEINTPPTFQVLPRNMTIKEIESELKPGFCSLSDLHAFFQDPPEGAEDGKLNIFPFPEVVVDVHQSSVRECWSVNAWRRNDYAWDAGNRVFSPAVTPQSPEAPSVEAPSVEAPSVEILEIKLKVETKEKEL